MVVEIFITMALEIIPINILGINQEFDRTQGLLIKSQGFKIKISKGQKVQTCIGNPRTGDLMEIKTLFHQQVQDPRLQLGVMDIGWMFL